MLNLLLVVGLFIWLIVAAILATTMGAMFAPDKSKVTARSILSVLLLAPTMIVVPLGFAAGILLAIIVFIVCVTIYGVRIICDLIKDGIPEMDDDGNVIEKETTVSPPWI
jgi:hypothetical protein